MGRKDKKHHHKKSKKKYKNKKHHHKKMGLGKKLLIGAGICAVAVGGLYLGKYLVDKHKNRSRRKLHNASGDFHKRELVDDPNPISPCLAKYIANADFQKYSRSMDAIPVPDAITVGLGWDFDKNTDYDLVAGCYDPSGNNLGYIQGKTGMLSLFNKAISHTGDNDGTTDVDTVLGDYENIILDLRAVPPQCSQILFGALIITPPLNPSSSRPYIHMLPMMRPEDIEAQKASGGTREIQYDDSDDYDSSDSDDKSHKKKEKKAGERGVKGEEEDDDDESSGDDRHDFVKLFHAELSDHPDHMTKKGFVAGKLFRNGAEWNFQPYRTVVETDPKYGLWPAFEYYAKYNSLQQQQQQPKMPQQPYGYPGCPQGNTPAVSPWQPQFH